MQDLLNKQTAEFFEKYSREYSQENYDPRLNIFMHERLNTIVNLTKKYLNKENTKILDIGCGSGEINYHLALNGYDGKGIDISNGMINLAKEKLKDFKNWNFEVSSLMDYNDTEKYDLVIASGLIEYFEDEDLVLDKLKSFTKNGGLIIINVTNIVGYPTCLNSITYHVKNNFIIKYLKEKIYKKKYGILNFRPKKHYIPNFKLKLSSKKLNILSNNYIGFSLLPAPFNFNFLKVFYKIDIYLQKLKFTPLKYLSASCVFCVRKN